MLPSELLVIPFSTFFTLGLAFLVSLTTTLLNRKFIDKEQFAKWREETNRWNADKNRAKKTGDKKLMAKVKKQELQILQIQSRMFKQQMKAFLVTFVPLLVVWQVLIYEFGNITVAFVPLLPGPPFPLPFFIWYMACSLFVSTMLSRIFGVEMGMGMGLTPPATK